MSILGLDLGGTKLASALFSDDGEILFRDIINLSRRTGKETGKLVTGQAGKMIKLAGKQGADVKSVGICVPGISWSATGRVWAPNIPGWNDYPLLQDLKEVTGQIPVIIDSDRTCYILGEVWKGNAAGCRDAIFLAVGTGIGAGILVNGEVLRGSRDIAGAIGWMALERPFKNKYAGLGCFEYNASGEGLARVARDLIDNDKSYRGELMIGDKEKITSHDVIFAWKNGDPLADKVIRQCIEFWGMASANLVSLFNPEKIIFGGGVFGPLRSLVPVIREEASRWAQPLGIKQVRFEVSALEGDAGVYGAGYLALGILKNK